MALSLMHRTEELTFSTIRDQQQQLQLHNRNLTDIAENAMNHVIAASKSSDSASQQAETSRTAPVLVCKAVYTQVT